MSKPGWAACHCVGEPAAEQPVDLDASVEFLAEVLTTGVGDAYAEGELEHDGGTGPVDGPDGGGGVPARRRAVRGRGGAPASSSAATSGRWLSSRACQGWSGIGAVFRGSCSPCRVLGDQVARPVRGGPARSRPSRWPARSGRQPSSAAGRSRATRVSRGGLRPRRGLRGSWGVGCRGCPSRSDCSAVRKRSASAGAVGVRRRSAMKSGRAAYRVGDPGRPCRRPRSGPPRGPGGPRP